MLDMVVACFPGNSTVRVCRSAMVLFFFGQATDKKRLSVLGEIDVFQCFAGLRVETNRNDMSVALCARCVAQKSVL